MNGSRHSISDQDGESDMDEDEEEHVERIGDDGGKLSNGTQKKEVEKMSNGDEQIGLNGKAESQDPEEEKMMVVNGDGLHASSPDEMSKQQKSSERNGEEKEMIEEASGENPASVRRTRRSLTEGKPV